VPRCAGRFGKCSELTRSRSCDPMQDSANFRRAVPAFTIDESRIHTSRYEACTVNSHSRFGLAAPVYAALQPGAQAPDFTTQATLAGKPFTFSLADALKKGPVVLYFYPAAFTPGCTVEAHEFAEATDKFKALGRHGDRRVARSHRKAQ
jgi:hypothetical protein